MIFVPVKNCKPGVAKVSFAELSRLGLEPGAWAKVLDGHGKVSWHSKPTSAFSWCVADLSLFHLASRCARQSRHGEPVYSVRINPSR